MREYYTNYEEFRYIIVSPEYYVAIQIDDPNRIASLINNEQILVASPDDPNRYIFKREIRQKYNDAIVNAQDKSIEDYFADFINFMNDIDSGFKVSLHKTDPLTGRIISKYINDPGDVTSVKNKIGDCNN